LLLTIDDPGRGAAVAWVAGMRQSSLLRSLSLLLFLPLVACVGSGRYDEAVKSADEAHADLARVRASDARALTELQEKLNAVKAEDEAVRSELARLGIVADTLSVEKGVLSTALGQSHARLEEIARAHRTSEARARLYRDLAVRLKKMVDSGDLSVALRDGRMVLQLPNDVLFASGQIEIRPRGQAALKEVASVLRTLDGRRFQVAGHTDNVPIETPRYASNWELSTARGVEVVHFLIAQGVRANALAAAGYGEFDPVSPNDDAKGRARNRRIEITLQPNVEEIVAVPTTP